MNAAFDYTQKEVERIVLEYHTGEWTAPDDVSKRMRWEVISKPYGGVQLVLAKRQEGEK